MEAAGEAVRVRVHLDRPLPDAWVGKVGFNLELFPGELFGRAYYLDEESGIFPRQLHGPMHVDDDGNHQSEPLEAAKLAGLNRLRLLEEPQAAADCYRKGIMLVTEHEAAYPLRRTY